MRLWNELRRDIRDALLERRFKEEQNQLKIDFQSLGDEYYYWLFTEKEHELMHQCPSRWFQESNHIDARYQNRCIHLDFSDSRRLPAHLWHAREELPSHIAKKYGKLLERKAELEKKNLDAGQQIMGVLKSVQTSEKLLKLWPEVAPFIPKAAKPEVCALAIPLKQLNAQLRLP